MDVEQLRERMRGFINTDYRAYAFEISGETIGYALVNHTSKPVYLRQFFICRNSRRHGYGKLAFEKLLEVLETKNIDIEVMHWNNTGYAFWKSLGFKVLPLDHNVQMLVGLPVRELPNIMTVSR
ncbi:GNAT family N-acetyltransferase [Cohnella soli]|uniref:GNAT family N-acetyltransferase n=1 Tax=Cohnella soli TaxID=425005 RepID=A0ABW0I1Z1_9BACL